MVVGVQLSGDIIQTPRECTAHKTHAKGEESTGRMRETLRLLCQTGGGGCRGSLLAGLQSYKALSTHIH